MTNENAPQPGWYSHTDEHGRTAPCWWDGKGWQPSFRQVRQHLPQASTAPEPKAEHSDPGEDQNYAAVTATRPWVRRHKLVTLFMAAIAAVVIFGGPGLGGRHTSSGGGSGKSSATAEPAGMTRIGGLDWKCAVITPGQAAVQVYNPGSSTVGIGSLGLEDGAGDVLTNPDSSGIVSTPGVTVQPGQVITVPFTGLLPSAEAGCSVEGWNPS